MSVDVQSHAAAQPAMLDTASLHGALLDPALSSVRFLVEVAQRFPDAISFASGLPHRRTLSDVDVNRYIDTYVSYVCRSKGLSVSDARLSLWQYGPTQGLIAPLISQFLEADEGIRAPQNSIVVTVGCQEAIFLVLRALFGSRRDVLGLVVPTHTGAMGAARMLDIDMLAFEERNGTIDCDRLARECDGLRRRGSRLRALYVQPTFCNPTGSVLDLETRRNLLDLAHREGFLLLEDDTYGFTALDGERPPSLKALDAHDSVLYFGTFAKTCMPGARVGFVVAPQRVRGSNSDVSLAEYLALLKSVVTVNTSPICQAIVGGMLLEHGGSLAALAAGNAALYRENAAHLAAALERHLGPASKQNCRIYWNAPQGGFFTMLTLPVRVDEELLEDCASRFGVIWAPMGYFYPDQRAVNTVRLSSSSLSREEIDVGVQRLANFIKERG